MKIRSVKPEFFTDPTIAGLDPYARLLFIGLWCIADDEGRGRYLIKQIAGEVFPHEQVDVDSLLSELIRSGRIVTYEVAGEHYFHIPTFARHQRPNRIYPSRLPAPPKQRVRSAPAVRKPRARAAAAPPVEVEVDGKGEVEVALLAPAQPARAQRDRDLLFEAVCAVSSIDWHELTEPERGKANKAVGELRRLGVTPEEVPIRAVNYALRFEKQPTPNGLVSNWAHCATPPPNLDRRHLRRRLEELHMGQFLDTWSQAS